MSSQSPLNSKHSEISDFSIDYVQFITSESTDS